MADAGFDSKYADESGPSGFEGKFEGKCGGAGDSSSDDDSDDDEWEALKGKKQTGEIVTSTDPVARKILDGFRMYVLGFGRDCETYRAPSRVVVRRRASCRAKERCGCDSPQQATPCMLARPLIRLEHRQSYARQWGM